MFSIRFRMSPCCMCTLRCTHTSHMCRLSSRQRGGEPAAPQQHTSRDRNALVEAVRLAVPSLQHDLAICPSPTRHVHACDPATETPQNTHSIDRAESYYLPRGARQPEPLIWWQLVFHPSRAPPTCPRRRTAPSMRTHSTSLAYTRTHQRTHFHDRGKISSNQPSWPVRRECDDGGEPGESARRFSTSPSQRTAAPIRACAPCRSLWLLVRCSKGGKRGEHLGGGVVLVLGDGAQLVEQRERRSAQRGLLRAVLGSVIGVTKRRGSWLMGLLVEARSDEGEGVQRKLLLRRQTGSPRHRHTNLAGCIGPGRLDWPW